MASLYQTAQNARRILLGVLVVVVLILLYDTFSRVQEGINTGNERRFYMNADLKFGNLPQVDIPSISLAEGSNPIFARLSVFPPFPDVAYVYRIEEPKEKLLTFENAIETAEVLGFSRASLREEGREMVWKAAEDTKTLRFNKDTQVWQLTTSYLDNLEARRRKTILNQTQTYANNATTLLNRLGFNNIFGFRDGQAVVRLALIGVDGSFIETQNASEAQYVSVNLFRKLPLADLKPDNEQPELERGEVKPQARTGLVYTSDPRTGIFRIVASNDLTNYSRDIFELNYIDLNYTGETGKYFIITPDEAWTKAQNGHGSLVSIEPQNVDYFSEYPTVNVRRFEMDARRTTLAYYEPREWNGYVTPIYIFEGTATLDDGRLANFRFFVDALQRFE